MFTWRRTIQSKFLLLRNIVIIHILSEIQRICYQNTFWLNQICFTHFRLFHKHSTKWHEDLGVKNFSNTIKHDFFLKNKYFNFVLFPDGWYMQKFSNEFLIKWLQTFKTLKAEPRKVWFLLATTKHNYINFCKFTSAPWFQKDFSGKRKLGRGLIMWVLHSFLFYRDFRGIRCTNQTEGGRK